MKTTLMLFLGAALGISGLLSLVAIGEHYERTKLRWPS